MSSSDTDQPKAVFKKVISTSLGAYDHIDAATRKALVDDLTHQLDEAVSTRLPGWVDRVAGPRKDSIFDRTIPEKAPAIWRKDKRRGEKPPDFVMRVYGPEGLDVLKEDGRGLVLSDLKHSLDPSLYYAALNWMQYGNEWPRNCPLPKEQEANTLDLKRLEAAIGPFSYTELQRLAGNQKTREKQL